MYSLNVCTILVKLMFNPRDSMMKNYYTPMHYRLLYYKNFAFVDDKIDYVSILYYASRHLPSPLGAALF